MHHAMNTRTGRAGSWARVASLFMGLGLSAHGTVLAQPTPAVAAPVSAAATQPGLPPVAPTQGQGYHDPRSAFKPLVEREGVVSWSVLAGVTLRKVDKALQPVYPTQVQALNDKVVKVQGFMMPLEPGDRQRHFLLSAVPTSCNFCVPAGPEGLIEIRTRTPVKYTLEPVLVQGRLAVLPQDPYGLYYRIAEAQPLQP